MIRALLLLLTFLTLGVSDAVAEERRALVIGISRYTALPALPNAANDARAIADALRRAGFNVTIVIDPAISTLRRAIAEAQTMAAGAQVAVFYYGGHAVQFRNQNYLLGVDADPRSMEDLKEQGIDLSRISGRLAASHARLIFIDACRDNPLPFVANAESGQGLAPMPAGVGTTIVFAAGPGAPSAGRVGGSFTFRCRPADPSSDPRP